MARDQSSEALEEGPYARWRQAGGRHILGPGPAAVGALVLGGEAVRGPESRAGQERMMRARDLMTPNPVTIAPQARIAEASDLMRELEIRHIPVVANGASVWIKPDCASPWEGARP